MKMLILGGTGMLGHKLVQAYKERFETWVTLRSEFHDYERFNFFERERTIGGVDGFDVATVVRAFHTARPEVVINAIGVIKQLPEADDAFTALNINSLFPHRLAALCRASGCRLISLSTDCVFNGRRGAYTEDDISDAEDMYGRTKFLGEVAAEQCLTLRTSIIGRELASSHGLVEWFLNNVGKTVRGYTEAIYTGLPTAIMAELIATVIEDHPDLSGVYHVSSDHISKYDLLVLMRDAYGIQIEIAPFDGYRIDRSLNSKRFRDVTGFKPKPWAEMINAMAADSTPYDEWRRTSGS